MSKKILGIDLSLTATGISDGFSTKKIGSKGKADDSLLSRGQRMEKIVDEVVSGLHGIDLIVIEQPAFSRTTGHMHDRSGMWWMLVRNLQLAGLWVVEVPPSTLKKYATGKGNCGKPEMVASAYRRLPDVETGADDNRVDALWLAAMGHDHLGQELVVMPAKNREALTAVRWDDNP